MMKHDLPPRLGPDHESDPTQKLVARIRKQVTHRLN